jgi:hypothetical protein
MLHAGVRIVHHAHVDDLHGVNYRIQAGVDRIHPVNIDLQPPVDHQQAMTFDLHPRVDHQHTVHIDLRAPRKQIHHPARRTQRAHCQPATNPQGRRRQHIGAPRRHPKSMPDISTIHTR